MKPAENITRTTDSKATCSICGSQLIYPVKQKPVAHDRWRLTMHCPECFSVQHSNLSTQELSAIGRRYCLGLAEIERDLALLELSHMAEECEKFIAAIKTGLIQPIDF